MDVQGLSCDDFQSIKIQKSTFQNESQVRSFADLGEVFKDGDIPTDYVQLTDGVLSYFKFQNKRHKLVIYNKRLDILQK